MKTSIVIMTLISWYGLFLQSTKNIMEIIMIVGSWKLIYILFFVLDGELYRHQGQIVLASGQVIPADTRDPCSSHTTTWRAIYPV